MVPRAFSNPTSFVATTHQLVHIHTADVYTPICLLYRPQHSSSGAVVPRVIDIKEDRRKRLSSRPKQFTKSQFCRSDRLKNELDCRAVSFSVHEVHKIAHG